MTTDVPIRCRCGAVTGTVTQVAPTGNNRVVCYCDDCQAFAHYLGRADDVLDANGGSDIFQTSQGRVTFTGGAEKLTSLHLTEKGALRWYASCCNTPIGNMHPNNKISFIGMLHSCLDVDAIGHSRDEVFGPVQAHVYRKFATGDRAAVEHLGGSMFKVFFRFFRMVIGARLRGDVKRSPFFDPVTGKPVVRPQRLNEEERSMLPPYAAPESGSK